MPALYADVPSTMSFAGWSITRRQNRMPTLALMPLGSDCASGRWVARMRMMPSAGPRLMIAVHSSSASRPYSAWVNSSWHSSTANTMVCRPSERRRDSSGVTFDSGTRCRGRPRMVQARVSSSRCSSRSDATHAEMASSSAPLA